MIHLGHTLITHTLGTRPQMLERCIESVNAALVNCSSAAHEVILVGDDFDKLMQARWHDAKARGGYVAFVDDDDTVSENILTAIETAMQQKPGLGLYYTNQMLVLPDGREVLKEPCRSVEQLQKSPTAIHHLAVMDVSLLTEESLNFATRHGVGVEWAMKKECAQGGICHVPDGTYYYHRHDQQTTAKVGHKFSQIK